MPRVFTGAHALPKLGLLVALQLLVSAYLDAQAAPLQPPPSAELVVVGPNDRREAYQPDPTQPTTVQLQYDTVTIKRGDTIKNFLLARGIYPGPNAYGFIYEANPDLRHVDSLKVGEQVILPILPDAAIEASREISEKALVVALLHREEKEQTAATFKDLASDAASFTGDRGNAAAAQLRNISRTVDQGLNHGPVTQGVLASLDVYGRLADKIVDRSSANASVDRKDLSALAAIQKGVKAVAGCINKSGQCIAPVEIRTLDDANNVLHGIEVYAAPYDLHDVPDCLDDALCAAQLRTLSSPARGELPTTPFGVWAMRNGKRISEVKLLRVRSDPRYNVLDLRVR